MGWQAALRCWAVLTGEVSLTYHFLMVFLQRNSTALLSETIAACKLMIDQPVRLRAVEPVHLSSSSRLSTSARIILSVVRDVSVDS